MTMLDNLSPELREFQQLINQLNSIIDSINIKMLNLNHKNIKVLNYVPLSADAQLGNATPKKGWIRSATISGTVELQMHDGTTWVTIARKAYVDAQDVATLNSAKSYADDGDATTLTNANSYTDVEVNDAKDYAVDKVNDHQDRCINYAT